MSRFTRSTMLLLAALLIPAAAFAQSGLSLMPDASDKSVSMFLSQLFGTLVEAAGGPGGGQDPLASSLGKLNELLMMVGGILLAYTLVAGTMQTAHDGEVLGKKWSSMWTPIRTSLGIAAITPYLNGYAIIQVVVMWLVLQGVGGANYIWKTYVSTTSPATTQSINSVPDNGVTEFAVNMLNTLVCKNTVEAKLFGLQGDQGAFVGNLNYQDIKVPAPVRNSDGGYRWTADGFGETGCGGFEPPKAVITESISQASAARYAQDAIAIRDAHVRATFKLIDDLQPLARAIAFSNESEISSNYDTISRLYKIQSYIDNYKKEILIASSESMKNTQRLENVKMNIEKDGWVTAGAWYVEWAKLNGQIRAQVGDVPTHVKMNSSVFNVSGLKQSIDTNINTKTSAILTRQNMVRENGVGSQVDSNFAASNQFSWSMSSDELKKYFWAHLNKAIFGNLFSGFVEGSGQTIGGEGQSRYKDPIIVAEDLGSKLIAGSSAAMLAGAVGSLLSSGIAMMTLSLVLPLLIFGMTLAYYIPFLPFIIWFGGVIGWLVMVIEAIIAAPLWAVAHVHPDGDGVVGRGGQGYSLILSLVLRPALMVIGLIVSMVLMLPVGFFFHELFLPAFNLAQGGASSFFGMFAGIAIYTIMLVNIVNKVVGLMHVIPDQLLRWMGGPSSDLGSYGQQANQGLNAAAGGFIGSAAGKAIEGGRGLQQVRETGRAANAQEQQNVMQERRAASEISDQISGMESVGAGFGVAHAAGQTEKTKAMDSAVSSLKRSDKDFGKKNENEKNMAIWGKVKEQNGGKTPDEVYESAAKQKYNELQGMDAKKSVPSMGKKLEANDRFADAFQNAKAQRSEASNAASTNATIQATVAAVRAQEDAKNKNGGAAKETD